ncbi:glycosyl hydrolase family 65 protein [Paenibacillus sp. FSL K6-1096]|uniref:glycoside hydrolase family 65 protein n=1 Tax=Paenibacillus sp. FSL K6-1096 TaxID=2921460 RepID=UPI0030ED925F
MSWTIQSNQSEHTALLQEESLYFTGNGYLGVRGNLEEYEASAAAAGSIRGTYLNAFHDITDIAYGEKLNAFPETQQKLVNIMDAQTVLIDLGEGDAKERFSFREGEIVEYRRTLHMDKGYSERYIHWRSPQGKELKLIFKRLVSFKRKELFIQEISLEPVNFKGNVTVTSLLRGDVTNFTDPDDPRVGSGHAKLLRVTAAETDGETAGMEAETLRSGLKAACVSNCRVNLEHRSEMSRTDEDVMTVIRFSLLEKAVITKLSVFTDTLRHGEAPLQTAYEISRGLSGLSFQEAAREQCEYLEDFWQHADIQIGGDQALQEGIRFNLFHLLQSAGRDRYSNIAAKGLSGEGYEGHYFWDTEIYMLPVFLMTHPEIARSLLLYRYSLLDSARMRAREMGHAQGALFPWRTISGGECSSYFPAGTAQYHISADIAYSFVQYYMVTGDSEFIERYGAELLAETARLWIDVGHYQDGKFKIDAVTGPDEYTAIVNNNYYTNVMAKHNLKWAARVTAEMKERSPEALKGLTAKLGITEEETGEWRTAAERMYLPYDPELGISPQDDTFLHKQVWDLKGTPKDKYPLLLHYHPLTLYRYQVCKQADAVLAHFLLEDEQDEAVIRASYHYYEGITTHDSSLSSCVFSIMASKLGEVDKAYDYFIETARMDLDNTHGNTKDGLHMANMGGTWMAIVFGFAGLRIKDSGLSLAPVLPKQWDSYAFTIKYLNRQLSVTVDHNGTNVQLLAGEELKIRISGEEVHLTAPDAVR